ncbi:hypothetical protein H4582DRAFT_1903189 [Lactarius indigo]|nr:hypothetical protein H4582DRAFT_1903189 [Lactarius indigo]
MLSPTTSLASMFCLRLYCSGLWVGSGHVSIRIYRSSDPICGGGERRTTKRGPPLRVARLSTRRTMIAQPPQSQSELLLGHGI